MTSGTLLGLAVAAMSLAVPAPAQLATVAGIVIDDRTEQPIKGVMISVDTLSSVVKRMRAEDSR